MGRSHSHPGTQSYQRPSSQYGSQANRRSPSSSGSNPQSAQPTAYIRAPNKDGSEPSSTLYLVIHAAHNLINKDTGILGDYSDPYVLARVGKQEHKTPVIDNNLNPVWDKENQFAFRLGERDDLLRLEVFNSNMLRDNSLGSTSMDIRNLPI